MRCVCLDVGCGGNDRYGFNPHCPKHCEVVFLDVAFPMLDIVQLVSNSASMHFVVASADKLPLRSETIDITYMWQVLEHVADDYAALCETHRVLKQGGMLRLAVPNFLSKNARGDPDHKHVYNIFSLRRKIRKAGFKHIFMEQRAGSLLPKPLRLLAHFLINILTDDLVITATK